MEWGLPRTDRVALGRLSMVLAVSVLLACSGKKEPDPGRSGTSPKTVQRDAVPEEISAPATFTHRLFPSAREALEHLLDQTNAAVIGFGEFHQQSGTKEVVSAIERFSADLLPGLSGRISDLVVETWISTGRCGEQEKKVTEEVEQVSDRPAETEDETIRMIKRAAALGIQPHVLKLDCGDYDRLEGDAGIDYLKLLELVGERLGRETIAALDRRQKQAKGNDSSHKRAIAVYGGAIHNDAEPDEMWKSVSFVPLLEKSVASRYVEIDLYVPEFIEVSEIAKQEKWFPLFEERASPTHALLIELSPKSFIIVFKRGVLTLRPK